jgi:hypothetical protein
VPARGWGGTGQQQIVLNRLTAPFIRGTGMSTALDQFRAAIAEAGLTPPEFITTDGKLHRFSSDGRRGDKAINDVLRGSYVLRLSIGSLPMHIAG